MTEPELDNAIDRAVRELMDVDTDAAFRARVSARLHEPARRVWGWVPRLAAATLTAAAVLIGLLWLRPGPAPVPAASPTVRREPVRTAPAAPVAAVRPGPAGGRIGPRPVGSRAPLQPIPRGTLVAAVADEPSTGIPPLAVDAIEVEPISQEPIETRAIVVAPLSALAELPISPLEPRTARH